MNNISESSLSPPRLKQKAFSEIKDFDLLACIGSGAFGKVYNAKDNINKMEFALKVIFFSISMKKINE